MCHLMCMKVLEATYCIKVGDFRELFCQLLVKFAVTTSIVLELQTKNGC